MNPTRAIPKLFVAVAATSLLVACGQTAADSTGGGGGDDDSTLKVGVLIPTSGVYATIGEHISQGFQVYLDQNDATIGDREVEIVVADTAGDPATGKTAAERLIQQEDVDVIVGVVSSAVGLAIKPVVAANKTPLVITVASAVEVGDTPYVWRSNLPATGADVGAAPVVGRYLAEEIGDGVYTAASDYAGGQVQIEGFLNGYEGEGATPAGSVFTPFQTTNDYQPYLGNIRAENPKAVYAFYAGAEAVNFVKQYDQFGLSVPLYGMNTIASQDVTPAEGEAAVGVRSFTEYTSELDNEVNQAFVSDYEEENGESPSWYAATAYLAGQMLEQALGAVEASGDTRADITEGLTSLEEIESPMGTTTFAGEDQSPTTNVYLVEVVSNDDGKTEYKLLDDLGPAN
jgi:branched-chain amino acid transport system substrate-binding protein